MNRCGNRAKLGLEQKLIQNASIPNQAGDLAKT
jgi:hypothetical protein